MFLLCLLCLNAPAAQLLINVGAAANDGTGDTLRSAFAKANTNFANLFTNQVPGSQYTNFYARTADTNFSLYADTNFFTLGGSGDVTGNGTISVADLSKVTSWLGGTLILTEAEYARADVNGDGFVNFLDADMIGLMAAGLLATSGTNHMYAKYLSSIAWSADQFANVIMGANRDAVARLEIVAPAGTNALALTGNFQFSGILTNTAGPGLYFGTTNNPTFAVPNGSLYMSSSGNGLMYFRTNAAWVIK